MSSPPSPQVLIPPERAKAAREVAAALTSAGHVVLTTHVNADGDGVGSEIGLWHMLRARGTSVTIANPTRIPERFNFLIPAGADASAHAVREIERADIVASLDIGDITRLGELATVIRKREPPFVCIDHHVGPVKLPSGPCLIAPEATATAELVFDLAMVAGWPLTPESAQALYVGLLTDTGGFRFSNTTARALRVAAALLEKGVDPESIYAQVYASAPEGRVRLLAEVLQTLVVEPEVGLAWVSVPADALRRHEGTADDLDGIVEFPRSIAGVKMALLFRHIGSGRIKISFRSMGEVDVAALAHQFGGGGHHRAAGASVTGSVAGGEGPGVASARADGAAGRPAAPPPPPTADDLPALGKALAISSGKGGVGKSTVSANLAAALAREGYRVGLMDADIYGPNIPRMFGLGEKPEVQGGKIQPLEAHGVKLMSLGFIVERDAPAIWRGPIIMKIIGQFVRDVAWGELDYFLVDLPPGTGDAQLSLTQIVRLHGAVIVTTPQEMAVGDSLRGAKMFERVGVGVVGVVENMSYFVCPHCHTRSDVFLAGGGGRLAAELGVPLLGQIPLQSGMAELADRGEPIVVSQPG